VRRSDLVLEVPGGDERLALPEYRLHPEMRRELPVEPLDHPAGDQPLRPHIRR
jgi:hypothetical protein